MTVENILYEFLLMEWSAVCGLNQLLNR